MTASFIAQLGSFDFADYVRVGASEGLDPYGKGWAEPQFAESAFGAGQALTGVTVGNREMVWPLYLNRNFLLPGDDLTPEETLLLEQHIHELVVDMNRAIAEPNLQLQWCDAHAPAITYYDVAYARFDPEYNHRQDQFGWKAGTLRVWCNPPYGHTGTHRVVATSAGGSAAARIPVASTLQGDVAAALDMSVRRGGVEPLAVPGRTVAFAPVPSGIEGLIPAPSMVAGANATITGGVAEYVPAAGVVDQGGLVDMHVSPGTAYAGRRMRVLAVVEPRARSGLRVQAFHDGRSLGQPMLATAVAGRALLDLGVLEVSPSDTRATQTIGLRMTQPVGSLLYGGATGGVRSGVHAAMVAPEDALTVIRDTPGALAGFDDTRAPSAALLDGRYDSVGNAWSDVSGVYHNGVSSAVGVLWTAASYVTGGLDQRGIMPTSVEASNRDRAAWLMHRPLDDLTITAGVAPDPSRALRMGVQKDIYDPVRAGATPALFAAFDMQYHPQGPTQTASAMLRLFAFSDNAAGGTILATAAIPSAAPSVMTPGVMQLVQRGDSLEGRLYSLSGSCVAVVTGSFPGMRNPGRARVMFSDATGAIAARFTDVEVVGVSSVTMSPTDTYCIASGGYRSHPSHGFSGEVAVVGAAPELPLDTAAVVVAIGGHEPGDAPSVNDVTIRAQERFTLAR